MYKILIVDDVFDENLMTLRNRLSSRFEVQIENSFANGMAILQKEDFDIVFLDINFKEENKNGIELLKWIKDNKEFCDVVMISGLAGFDDAVLSVKYGAYDFLEKPFSVERLNIVIDNILERKELLSKIESQTENRIISNDKTILKLIEQSKKYAKSSANILIRGESGTGKDLFAEFIHNKSSRKNGEFVKVNCSAIPDSLFESEFFGYKKGAFTGAIIDKMGKFEQANGGTLFLDEIGDLPLSQQAKLLRVIEDGEITRLGDNVSKKVDFHLITATNRDLEEMVKNGEFREDLFYRLNIISINLPPLRERVGDIELLSKFFISYFSKKEGYIDKELTDDAVEFLKEQKFFGNVRELKNLLYKVFVMSDDILIKKSDFVEVLSNGNKNINRVDNVSQNKEISVCSDLFKTMPLSVAKKELEKRYIIEQLKKFDNNVSATAKALDIIPNNLFRKIKQLNIEIK